jgi:hypothetical protein
MANGNTEIRFGVTLTSDTFYRLVLSDAVGESGSKLEYSSSFGFSTGASLGVLGSISGEVRFVGERNFEGSVVLFDEVGNLVARESLLDGGAYTFSELPNGTYNIFADVFADGAGSVSGGYDANNDGTFDTQVISSGQVAENVDIILIAPTVSDTPSSPINSGASVVIDLDKKSGNQSLTESSVTSNGEIFVSIYAQNVTNLVGYTVTLAYDSTQVSFKRVGENGLQSEKNMLFSNKGRALFISTPPENGKIEFTGAALGGASSTTPSGEGLLGVFRFIPNDQFSTANFHIDQAIFQSGDVRDTLVTVGRASVVVGGGLDTPPSPSDPGEEIPGFILVDLDNAEGNQSKSIKNGVKKGDVITLQLFGEGFPEVVGFGIIIEFDQNSLSYNEQSFTVGDFILGATPLATDKGGIIDAGAASFTGGVGSGNGYLGKLDFTVMDAYSDSTFLAVTIVGFSLKSGGVSEEAIRVIARLNSEGPVLAGDFDGDGSVGFRDFLLFAQGFGGSDPVLDIDGDGSVGFRDFLTFAQNFGKSTKRLAKLSGRVPISNQSARVNLNAIVSKELVELRLDLQDFDRISGFAVEVEFDPSMLEFVEATTSLTSVFGGNGFVNINQSIQPGRLLLADIFETTQAISETELTTLKFQSLKPFNSESIAIKNISISDWEQTIVEIEPASLNYNRPKSLISLGDNYPNPFNPATQIPYALPRAGMVHLTIYNLLGQEARALVNGLQNEGDYAVDWDGRDNTGSLVASGLYFYRLEFDDFVESKRMILLK